MESTSAGFAGGRECWLLDDLRRLAQGNILRRGTLDYSIGYNGATLRWESSGILDEGPQDYAMGRVLGYSVAGQQPGLPRDPDMNVGADEPGSMEINGDPGVFQLCGTKEQPKRASSDSRADESSGEMRLRMGATRFFWTSRFTKCHIRV